eukprot:TRINITY_DN3514_c0_g1_i1.p1 TRINITY_DN3514_c0_g1~~TRINITY_DN3514_c0_g1_i1.p1  ORF type:complete len:132 (-),score=57.32 TRINITY_DN3514_c0_g1_i1:18-413(-)
MIRRPPRSTQSRSSAASDVYKRQDDNNDMGGIAARRGQFLYNLTDLADGDSGPNTQSKQEAIRDWVSQRDVTDTAPRDDPTATTHLNLADSGIFDPSYMPCLLYTSDAADDLLCVDLGGRRIIKKKTEVQR